MAPSERPQEEPGNPRGERASPAAAGGYGGEYAPRFWQRVAFWRALAGVGFALALAAVIVAAEFSSILINRTHLMSRRIARLNVQSRHLKSQIARDGRKIAAMSEASANDAVLKRILAAPDLRLVRMSATGRSGAPGGTTAGAAGPPKPAPDACAVIAISNAERSAVLQAGNLPPASKGSVYSVWWMPRRGAPVAAGRFRTGADGVATMPIAQPPKDVASAAIFEQDASAAGAPAGAPILKSAAIR
jgi:hypothetical protein